MGTSWKYRTFPLPSRADRAGAGNGHGRPSRAGWWLSPSGRRRDSSAGSPCLETQSTKRAHEGRLLAPFGDNHNENQKFAILGIQFGEISCKLKSYTFPLKTDVRWCRCFRPCSPWTKKVYEMPASTPGDSHSATVTVGAAKPRHGPEMAQTGSGKDRRSGPGAGRVGGTSPINA